MLHCNNIFLENSNLAYVRTVSIGHKAGMLTTLLFRIEKVLSNVDIPLFVLFIAKNCLHIGGIRELKDISVP